MEFIWCFYVSISVNWFHSCLVVSVIVDVDWGRDIFEMLDSELKLAAVALFCDIIENVDADWSCWCRCALVCCDRFELLLLLSLEFVFEFELVFKWSSTLCIVVVVLLFIFDFLTPVDEPEADGGRLDELELKN